MAVLLVVANHVWGWPGGGYVGVDVFFVISGFLITGNLLRSLDGGGWISIRDFYARRIKRILPAALLVLALTVAVAYLLWYRPRADQTLLDAASAAVWVSNYHFAATGTDYLAGQGAVSPVQHYWSLSVEEQFYLAWPWLLLVPFLLATRWRRSPRAAVLGTIGVVGAVSFAWSVLLLSRQPQLGYFDTVGRAWEFALGALAAATAATLGTRLGRAWWTPIGLVLVVAAAVLYTGSTAFPGVAALLPVLGAALVVGSTGEGVGSRLLDNPPMRWVGDISYSLYLWHFPVVVFGHVLLERSPLVDLGLLALMLALSALSYRFVEEPVRRSSWLSGWKQGPAGIEPRARRREALVGMSVVLVVAALVVAQFNPERRYVVAGRADPAPRAAATAPFATFEDLRQAVVQGAGATTFDGTTPSPDVLYSTQLPETMDPAKGCAPVPGSGSEAARCTLGDGSRTVVLLGDSVAATWAPTVQAALGDDVTVHLVTAASCAPWDVNHGAKWGDPAFPAACAAVREAHLQQVQELEPDLIVVSSAAGAYPLQVGQPDLAAGWRDGVRRTVTDLARVADVVVVGAPPIGADPQVCMNKVAGPSACDARLDPVWEAADRAEAAGVAQARGDVRRVEVRGWFCTADGACPQRIGDLLVRTDTTHLTNAMAESLGPVLAEALRR